MKALPDGYLPISSYHGVAFGGQVTQVGWSDQKRVADSRTSYHPVRAYDANHPFSKRFYALESQTSKLREEREMAESAAQATLNSCLTLKQLLEIWPEAAPFAEEFAAPPEVRALTLSIKDLNTQLGLPLRAKNVMKKTTKSRVIGSSTMSPSGAVATRLGRGKYQICLPVTKEKDTRP